MVRDPVCGLPLDADHALSVIYHGKRFYFCSHDCRVNFEDRPDDYAHVHPKQRVDQTIMEPFKPLLPTLGSKDLKN